jgi:hypothetical protein
MRSKKPELEEVVSQFEAWRAKRHGRLIPDELWEAALSLLDRYPPSTICRHLRLDAGRFKQIRVARDGVKGSRTAGSGRSGRRGERRNAAGEPAMALAPRSNGFVELPALGVGIGSGMSAAMLHEFERGPAGCRLSLESSVGTLTLVTASRDGGLVEAVCRLVLGAFANGSRT